jgi:hypothetical protein
MSSDRIVKVYTKQFYKQKKVIMKQIIFTTASVFSMLALVAISSCSDDEPETITETVTVIETDTITVEVDSALPMGMFTVTRQGSLVAQSGTPTEGAVELGQDTQNSHFIRFGDDFMTELATGTVGIFLSTSAVYTPDPGNGNPDLRLVGNVRGNGEMFIKLDAEPDAKFTHIILWCATASIPFGNAELQ